MGNTLQDLMYGFFKDPNAYSTQFLNGTGAPGALAARKGDYYLNNSNGDMYYYNGTAWSLKLTLNTATGSTDHGLLSGLTDDDHLLYPLMFIQPVTPPNQGSRKALWWNNSNPAIVKPMAANTGCSGTLTPVSGTQWVDTPGSVLENLDISGRVVVRTSNVTIRNCKIHSSGYAALLDCGNANAFNILIEDCTLYPDTRSNYYNGIAGHDFTARRLNISGCVDSFACWNTTNSGGPLNVLIENCYSHHLYVQSPDANHADNRTHNDHVQIHTGGGVTIRGNNFEGVPHAGSTPGGLPIISCLMVNGGSGANLADILVEDNWMEGGTAVINAGDTSPASYTARIYRNIFNDIDSGYDIVASPKFSFPGLPTSTGPDLNNGNVYASGGPVTVHRI